MVAGNDLRPIGDHDDTVHLEFIIGKERLHGDLSAAGNDLMALIIGQNQPLLPRAGDHGHVIAFPVPLHAGHVGLGRVGDDRGHILAVEHVIPIGVGIPVCAGLLDRVQGLVHHNGTGQALVIDVVIKNILVSRTGEAQAPAQLRRLIQQADQALGLVVGHVVVIADHLLLEKVDGLVGGGQNVLLVLAPQQHQEHRQHHHAQHQGDPAQPRAAARLRWHFFGVMHYELPPLPKKN